MTARRIEVALPGRTYGVHVGDGLLERLTALVERPARAEVAAVVTDANVAALHGDRLRTALAAWGVRVEQLTLEPGEAAKTPANAAAIWRWMAASGVHRGDVVIAFGGGVIGDLAGFAAATYHRGIDVVQVPTSLLAQVDASIGGKTGVDLPEGKNLVGAFHQPVAVVSDTGLLATLPDEEYITGLAEMIKHGLIADGQLLRRIVDGAEAIIGRDGEVLAGLVGDAAAIKATVVARDEREAGERAHLNYGHTLAHALEALGGYDAWTHGRAVAVGMMFAATLAVRLGYADRIGEHREALTAFGLPVGGAGASYEDVASMWVRDKKYEAGMRFVVLEDLGRPVVVRDVPEQTLREAYEAVR